MPARWQVLLNGPLGVDVPVEAPHAVVSRWLDLAESGSDGPPARQHQAPVKPYSVTPPTVTDGQTVLEIRLLDDALADRLRARARPGIGVRLGPTNQFRISSPPRQVDAVDWPDLLAWHGERAWDIELLTPATVRNRHRTSPFLAPRSVLAGLLARFPPEHRPSGDLPDIAALAATIWVPDIDGHTVVVNRASHIVAGFLGRIRFACDGTAEQAATVHALLQTAQYSGIGSHTAWGFGVTRVAPSRPPRSARRAP